MPHCGYHAVTARFNFYLENDNVCVDGSGTVDGTCYFEQYTWESPGCEDHELDVDTLSIEGNMSTKEGDFEDCKKLELTGIDAWNFLEENGFDESDIEWDVDDNYYDEEDYDDYD
tara:strand:+ start:454 stop:798 length:345 start_codon:yes stop_codon:yes gene_type:complete